MVLIPDRWYYSSVPTAILALERTITIESFLPAGESARVRFLREARAAAKVRHPNVASRLPPWEERRRVFLRHGVCGGRDAGKPDQALPPPCGQTGAGNLILTYPAHGEASSNAAIFGQLIVGLLKLSSIEAIQPTEAGGTL
jgi:hypothetical protein